MTALTHYITELQGLIEKLSPAQTRTLNQELASELRRRNARRIQTNIEPEGGAMTPRQAQPTRPLRSNETIKPGQKFLYLGNEVYMRNIKTQKSADNPSRPSTQSYNSRYIWGYAYDTGIRKYRRDWIEMPAATAAAKKRARMFKKIHRFTYLKQQISHTEAAIGYPGGLTAYIAAAHQHGLGNRPERRLLGFSQDDLRYIQDTVISHLAASI